VQVLAGCVAQSIVIQAGVSMAFSAVLLPQLMQNDSVFTATTDQQSWIGMSHLILFSDFN
jgi:hypothetical protein